MNSNRPKKRAHILEGLIIASDNIDEVIALIRASKTPDEAREKLMKGSVFPMCSRVLLLR
ncbi:MAG: hypothetical protein R2744_01795 [Bacteroidales bacterium]